MYIKKYLKRILKKKIQEIEIENVDVAEVVQIIPLQKELLNNYLCSKYPNAQIVQIYYIEPL